MKNLILFLMMLMVPQSFAQTTPNTQAYFEFLNSPVNMIKNPHARLNTVNTVFGGSGAKGRATGSTELYGLAAHTCSTTAVSSYCELVMNAAKAPFNSANKRCEASILYNGANADLMALSYTPSGGQEVLVPLKAVTGTDYAEGYVELACSSGTGVWRLKQITAGTTGTIKYGGYYGPSTRTGKQSDPNTFTAYVDGLGNVGRETGPGGDWINGNCAITSTSYYTCTFKTGIFTSAPNCNATLVGTPSTAASSASASTDMTTVGIRTWAGAAYSPQPFFVTCTKTDPASQYTVATVDNQSTGLTLFTPVLSTGAFNPSATSNKFTYTLSGPYMFIDVDYVSAAAGTTGSGLYQLTLPGGYEISPVANNTAASATNFGTGYAFDGANERTIFVRGNTTTQLAFAFPSSPTVVQNLTSTNFPLGNTNIRFAFTARVPIKGRENAIPSGLINIDVPVYTVTRLTSGSGTYTPPAGVKWLEVQMVGAGGGGAGSGTSTGGAATAGTSSTLGTSLFTAGGGGSGVYSGSAGAPGTCTMGGGIVPIVSLTGGTGGSALYTSVATTFHAGAIGGVSFFGGNGTSGSGDVGRPAVTNSGSGGAGGGLSGNTGYAGAAGSAGGYCNGILASPSAMPYVVGAGGAGGTAGPSGYVGGAGGSGVIIIKEHYTNFTPALASGLLQRIAPQTAGMVTSDDAAKIKFMMFKIENGSGAACSINGACTITGGIGTTGLVSSRTSAGSYTTNLPSLYPNGFKCFPNNTGTAQNKCLMNTTNGNVFCSQTSTMALTDEPVDFACFGPRP